MAQFVSWVAYAPPGTALFHQRNKGWSTGDYLMAQAVDDLNYLAWCKTRDAQRKNPKNLPQPIPRPYAPAAAQSEDKDDKPMTVAEYARRSGLKIDLEGR